MNDHLQHSQHSATAYAKSNHESNLARVPGSCGRWSQLDGSTRVKLRARARARARLRVKRQKVEAARQKSEKSMGVHKAGIVKAAMFAVAATASVVAISGAVGQLMSCMDHSATLLPLGGMSDMNESFRIPQESANRGKPQGITGHQPPKGTATGTAAIVSSLPLPSQVPPSGLGSWDAAADLVRAKHPGRRPGIGDRVRLKRGQSTRISLIPALKAICDIGYIIDDDPSFQHVPYHVMGPNGDVGFAGIDDIDVLEASSKTGRPAGTDAAYWLTRVAQIQEEWAVRTSRAAREEKALSAKSVEIKREMVPQLNELNVPAVGQALRMWNGQMATVTSIAEGWVSLRCVRLATPVHPWSNTGTQPMLPASFPASLVQQLGGLRCLLVQPC